MPIESKEAIEKEIDYMLEEGIVVEQIGPTPWVSSATFPKKANGDTRVCLDPKDLNKAIIRENHKPMTVEGDSTQAGRSHCVHQGRRLEGILTGTPHIRSFPADHV